MKKFVVVMLLAVVLLTGCGEDKQTAGTDTSNGSSAVEEGSQSGGSSAAESAKGYVFEYQGVTVSIDALAAPVLESLGEPASYFEAASCAFEGLDRMYTFGSIEIDTYPAEDGDRISTILLKDDMVQTPEGVGLFMTKADMTAAYGENYTEENGMAVYEKDGMKLRFILENEEITSIEYVSTVLE